MGRWLGECPECISRVPVTFFSVRKERAFRRIRASACHEKRRVSAPAFFSFSSTEKDRCSAPARTSIRLWYLSIHSLFASSLACSSGPECTNSIRSCGQERAWLKSASGCGGFPCVLYPLSRILLQVFRSTLRRNLE